jgi:hypothetical protein
MSKLTLLALFWVSVILGPLLGFWLVQRRAEQKRIAAEQAFIRDMNYLRKKRKAALVERPWPDGGDAA